MPDRKSLVPAFWLAASLALLASVAFAPGRMPGSVAAPVRAEGLRRGLAFPLDMPPGLLGATPPADDIPVVNALPSEDEEQDRAEALDGPRVGSLISWCFRKAPDRQAIAPRSIPSLYPLRC